MDREEWAYAIGAGEASATMGNSDEERVGPALSDADAPVARPDDRIASTVAPAPHRPLAVSREDEPAGEVNPAQVIEALLFASDTPLSAGRLAELAGTGSVKDVRRHIEELNKKYAAAVLSFRIEEIARGYQMMTLPVYRPWLAKLDAQRGRTRLSPAALETLSIVAYKQPIIRADVEAIRGVGCGEVLNRLREMGLVRIIGRAEIIGRPMLYGTTRKFLDVFGLADLDDLPPLEMLNLRRAASSSSPDEPVTAEEAPPETPVAIAGA